MTTLVVAGIYVKDGKLLLARRPLGGHLPGLWEFPGGKVEPNETPESALVREWREELAVTAAGLVPYGFGVDARPERHVTLLFFKIRALLGAPQPVGCEAFRFSPAEEARLLALPPADQPILARLIAEGRGSLLDTEDSDTPDLLDLADESEGHIAGSEALEERRVVKFRKAGLLGLEHVEGILVATDRGPRAYVNVCPHVPIPLDRGGDEFLSEDGATLACRSHGALFDPGSGVCVSGPCRGESLRSIPVEPDGHGFSVVRR
ncbi:MAG TPA: NUDIX domain-containing protein [Thermoanaerobaculia bacterium]|nr:NUDIX domain-containing protein [Thermoanaerobaculia bacterium]